LEDEKVDMDHTCTGWVEQSDLDLDLDLLFLHVGNVAVDNVG
jgi:hypothetical protein